MKRLTLVISVAALGFASAPAFAGGASGSAPGTNIDAIQGAFGSVGNFISGEVYGNTSNAAPSGNGVTPSLSPGPWVCANPADCSQGASAGGSMGEFIGGLSGVGSADFANGTSVVKENFGQPYQH